MCEFTNSVKGFAATHPHLSMSGICRDAGFAATNTLTKGRVIPPKHWFRLCCELGDYGFTIEGNALEADSAREHIWLTQKEVLYDRAQFEQWLKETFNS